MRGWMEGAKQNEGDNLLQLFTHVSAFVLFILLCLLVFCFIPVSLLFITTLRSLRLVSALLLFHCDG
jgi:hypothetical protein